MRPGETGRWKFSGLISECAANQRSFGTAPNVASLVGVAFVCVSVLYSAVEWRSFRETVADAHEKGAWTVVLESGSNDSGGVLDTSCASLHRFDAVEGAGHLRQLANRFLDENGRTVPTFSMAPSLVEVDVTVGGGPSPEYRLGDVLLPLEVPVPHSGFVGLHPDGVVRVAAGVARKPGTDTGNGVVFLEGELPGIRSEYCVVVLKPLSDVAQMAPLLISSVDSSGGEVTARFDSRISEELISRFNSRPGRVIQLGAGIVTGLLLALLHRIRSRSYATYAFAGSSRLELFALLLMESLFVASTAVLAGAASVIVLSGFEPALMTELPTLYLGFIGGLGLVGAHAVVMSRQSVVDLGKSA